MSEFITNMTVVTEVSLIDGGKEALLDNDLVLIKEEGNSASESEDSSTTEPASSVASTDKAIIIVCFLAVLFIVVAVFSNALAFLVFYKKPMFRKILANRLVMNLMTINIASCLTLFPAVLWDLNLVKSSLTPSIVKNDASMMTSSYGSPISVCIWSTLSSSLVAHTSLLAMLTIGLDQYVAVVYPLEYNQKVTRGMSVKLITLVWTAGFLASIVAASQLIYSGHRSPWASCRLAKIDFNLDKVSFTWLCSISGLFYTIPVLILTGIYLRIFAAASKSSRDIRRNSFHLPLPLQVEDPKEPFITLDDNKAGSAPDLLSPEKPPQPPIDLEMTPKPIRRRAPKLSALRNNSTFSKTVSSIGPEIPVNRQMSQQDRRLVMTPKRKCSFSSFSECRYVADGGKTRTFLISIEAASPTGHTDETVENQTESFSTTMTSSATSKRSTFYEDPQSSRETDHSSVSGITPAKIDIRSNPLFGLSKGSGTSPEPSPKLPNKTRHGSLGESSANSHHSLTKTGSLISMTSQAARRLSVNVSRRASSVYQFFQYKEELRTAKISALVIVVAFICWGPFFFNLILVGLLDSTFDVVQVMQHTTNLAMLAFTALSPFLYVFRSSKVQKCLGPVLIDTFCINSDVRLVKRRRRIIEQENTQKIPEKAKCEHLRDRSCSCPNIEESKNNEENSVDDAQNLRFNKFLYRPPSVILKDIPPVIVRTSSNLDVYTTVIYEEDGEFLPPDEDALSRRRMSVSVPFGLNLIVNSNPGGSENKNLIESVV